MPTFATLWNHRIIPCEPVSTCGSTESSHVSLCQHVESQNHPMWACANLCWPVQKYASLRFHLAQTTSLWFDLVEMASYADNLPVVQGCRFAVFAVCSLTLRLC
jgi:hypothetical protein